MRIGNGYDVHRLVKDRDLILGGVKIPYEKGLLGHSDADVLTHAVIDALLGACGMGDIGRHFPDSDIRFKDANSLMMLAEVHKMMSKAFFRLTNLDSIIVCQSPRLAEYIPQMRDNIAGVLCADPFDINIKAKTEEGLGFTGEGQGIAAHAVVLVGKVKPQIAYL